MTTADIEKAQRIIYLLSAEIKGELSESETGELRTWASGDPKDQVLYQRMLNEAERNAIMKSWNEDHREEALERVAARFEVRRRVRLWPRVAAVAAAVAMVVFGVWFFTGESGILKQVQDDVAQNDIMPGKNGATITLGNGKVIQLSDSKTGVVIGDDKFAYNDGSSLTTPATPPLLGKEGTFDHHSPPYQGGVPNGRGGKIGGVPVGGGGMTAKTAKGQTYEFTLPDGTKVWLNAASTLTIPSNFSGIETRKVFLEGEAYFEVSKNKKRPFIVESNGQEVTVLGTHFNINSYKDEGGVRTTLLEGSVNVNGTILKPNEQAILKNNNIKIFPIDANSEIDWKNGDFVFDGETLESLMRKISRWYNVEVEYAGEIPKDVLIGKVSRSKNISQVLKALGAIGIVHFKIEGRKVTVTR